MYDAYDAFSHRELDSEREAATAAALYGAELDPEHQAIMAEHRIEHEDGATDVNASIANICETIIRLRRELVTLRETLMVIELDYADIVGELGEMTIRRNHLATLLARIAQPRWARRDEAGVQALTHDILHGRRAA